MSFFRRSAIILAGGASTRMGQPKTMLRLNGITLLERAVGLLEPYFDQITVVTNGDHSFGHLPVTLVQDIFTTGGKNPLQGIHAGLLASGMPYQFVVACDMPFLNLDLINYMGEYAPRYDVVVPKIGSYYQPLHAYYGRSCIDIIERQILNRDFKITNFYARLKVRTVGLDEISLFDPHEESFFNINTWEDFDRARDKLSGLSQDLIPGYKGVIQYNG